ncbi:MAG: hypothetical protein ACREBE_16660, partial [bacterium]
MTARPAAATLSLVLAAVAVCAQEVVLPLDRYDALRALAQASPPPLAPPAVPFAFEASEITLRPGAETVRARTRLTLVLQAGDWQTIPLPAMGLLTAADLGALAGRVDPAGSLTVRGTGRHVVTLDSVIPLGVEAAATRKPRTLTLALPKAAAVTGTVIASSQDDLEFGGGALGKRQGVAGTWSFVAPRGGTLQLRILGPSVAPERARLPLRFTANSAILVQATRTRQAALGWVRWDVTQGALERLRVLVPTGYEVTDVGADGLGAWEIAAGVLEITPLVPITESVAVTVGLRADPQAEFAAPVLAVPGAEKQTLITSLSVVGDGTPEVIDAGSSREAEVEETDGLPENVRPERATVLRVLDTRRPPRWSVHWSEGAEVLGAQVDRLLVDVLAGEAGRAAYQAWAVVRTSSAAEIELALPPGFVLTGASRDGVVLTPGQGTEGKIVFTLARQEQPQVIHVAGLLPWTPPPDAETLAIPVPRLSTPAATVEVRAVLPGGREYVAEGGVLGYELDPPPPARPPTEATGGLAALRVRARASASTSQDWFPAPAGSVILLASWSAVSTTPGPLALRVRSLRVKPEWF